MNGKKLVAVAASAAMIASATPCVALAAEDASANEGAVATQSVTRADVTVKDVSIKASSLKTNLMQMKWQIKDLMLVSPTSGAVYGNIEVQLPSNYADLQARKPGSYQIKFIYAPDVVGTATLTLVSDDAPAEVPSFSAADAAAVAGAARVTVYGGGQTNEAHNLVASSLKVSNVSSSNGTYVATATINSALAERDYESTLAPVNQGKFVYDARRSSLIATFTYNAKTKAWEVTTPAQIAFAQAPKPTGDFSFKKEVTVEPSAVKGMSARQLVAYLKQQLVETAKVDGQDVVDSDDFSVALGNQLNDIVAGKPGSYRIEFMYNGTGYNNEVVGSSTLTITEEKSDPEVKPGAGTDAKDNTVNAGSSDDQSAAGQQDSEKTAEKGNGSSKPAKKTQQKKALPQTGDVVAALPGVLGAAGALLAGIGHKLRRH